MISRAAILERSRAPLVVDEIEVTEVLEYGQVLVQLLYSGICASQVHEIEARKGPDPFLPHLLGHEGSGVVLQVGKGVGTVVPGDFVVLHWRPGAGIDAPTPTYRWDSRTLNAGSVTTFNSHAIVSENRVTAIPRTIDPRHAPLLGCAVTTAFGAVTNDAGLKLGESVAVFGVGGVGLAAVYAAALTSAFPIIAVDIAADKLDAAVRVGATHVILSSPDGPKWESIRTLIGPNGLDVAIETTGLSEVIAGAYDVAGPQGRVVLVGVPEPSDPVTLRTLPLHFGKVLTGSHGGAARPDQDLPRLVRLIEAGLLDLNMLPVEEHPLEDINLAITRLKEGHPGRQLIRFS